MFRVLLSYSRNDPPAILDESRLQHCIHISKIEYSTYSTIGRQNKGCSSLKQQAVNGSTILYYWILHLIIFFRLCLWLSAVTSRVSGGPVVCPSLTTSWYHDCSAEGSLANNVCMRTPGGSHYCRSLSFSLNHETMSCC